MDKGIELLALSTNKVADEVSTKISQLQHLHEEKFRSIQIQFLERDTRTDKMAEATSIAVGAALQAAKEAAGKQAEGFAELIKKIEATFTKQIDQIGELIRTQQKSADDKIDDLKSRVQAVESQKKGTSDTWGYIIGILGLLIAAGAALAVVMKHS